MFYFLILYLFLERLTSQGVLGDNTPCNWCPSTLPVRSTLERPSHMNVIVSNLISLLRRFWGKISCFRSKVTKSCIQLHNHTNVWSNSRLRCYCTLQGDGNATIPTLVGGWGGVNQLPLSRGRAGASRERQDAGRPHQRAVIMWFTHSQLLIASRWAAPTRCSECSVNSPALPLAGQGSRRRRVRECLNAAGPRGPSRRGFGLGLDLCSDSLIGSWLERLRVASHPTAESNPEAVDFISRIFLKGAVFFLPLHSVWWWTPCCRVPLRCRNFAARWAHLCFDKTQVHVSAPVQRFNSSFNYVTLKCRDLKWDALNHPGLMR